MSNLNLKFGAGNIDITLNLVNGKIELYSGNNCRYGEEIKPDSFHARYGGKQYYQSCSGASGAGWIPGKPTLKQVNGYRVDVSSPWISLGSRDGHPPLLVNNKEIWVPFEYRGFYIPDDWPVVICDQSGQLTFCSIDDTVQFLRGKLETTEKKFCTRYLKDVNSSEQEHCVTINVSRLNRHWANARRLVELLHVGEIGFNYPKNWQPEGDNDFWEHLGFQRISDKLYKVTRGVCRYMVAEWDFDIMKRSVPTNVHPIAPDFYLQERDSQYTGFARFQFEKMWYDCEIEVGAERAFDIFAGNLREIRDLKHELEAGANKKYVCALEDAQVPSVINADQACQGGVTVGCLLPKQY